MTFITSYHLHTYGSIERVSKILKIMLIMYVMHQQRKWEEYLPLVEFAYNNGYQEYLKKTMFEALYGWSCNTHISWSGLVNKVLIGLDMLIDMVGNAGYEEESKGSTRQVEELCIFALGI